MSARAAGPDDPTAAFLSHLAAERRCADATVLAYGRELARLRRLTHGRDLAGLTAQDIRACAARLHQAGMNPRSVARALSAWRTFYAWACRRQGFAANPAAGVRAPRAARTLPKALSVDQAQGLLDAAWHGEAAPADLRDRAMFELFYSAGLRLAELVGLDLEPRPGSRGWVDARAGEVTVTGKGAKTRIVPVGRRALDALAAWRGVRAQMAAPGEPAWFVGARGARIAAATVQARLKQAARRAGIAANVHPHVLRHSFASHLLQSSGDLRAVQELLGHANISTTQVYTHLDFQQLARVYDAAHPRARRK
ncbi:MAG: tyrosine recombinase XerC [Burkholderiales bacterium]|nr:tyrosine recombinase XerC [Burkholderiales bacterium]